MFSRIKVLQNQSLIFVSSIILADLAGELPDEALPILSGFLLYGQKPFKIEPLVIKDELLLIGQKNLELGEVRNDDSSPVLKGNQMLLDAKVDLTELLFLSLESIQEPTQDLSGLALIAQKSLHGEGFKRP